MLYSSAILFPHSQITSSLLKAAVELFGKLTICQPWFAEPLTVEGEPFDDKLVKTLYPPSNLQPKENITKLITDYLQWMGQNSDQSRQAFLRIPSITNSSENAPWQIKQMIRKMQNKDKNPQNQNNILKWHLILHLAKEIEENKLQSQEMLMRLKQKKSPVEDALEDRTTLKGLFEDLPTSVTEPLIQEHQIDQILYAWVGLFGEYLGEHESLITFDKQVMDHVTGSFENSSEFPSPSEVFPFQENSSSRFIITIKQLPVSDNSNTNPPYLLKCLSGRPIILIQHRDWTE